jgi:cytochrome P450
MVRTQSSFISVPPNKGLRDAYMLLKGPIVRVNARELHIHDPHFYSNIYAGSGRRVNKDPGAVAAYTVPRASLATIDHELHRVRRGILSPYFAKRSIVRLEPIIQERIDRLCMRLEESLRQAMAVDLDSAFAALTADIVTHYFYGSPSDYLGSKNFKFEVRDAILGLIGFYHLTRFLPVLASTIKKLPIPIVRLLQPGAAALLCQQALMRREILDSLAEKKPTNSKAVIVEALKDPNIPPQEKTIDRLQDEGTTIIFAGTETTARALSVMMFHLLHNKSLLMKLREELNALPSVEEYTYSCTQLETLPYLVSRTKIYEWLIENKGFHLTQYTDRRCQ